MTIAWTKSWSASDDGTIVSGVDLGNIQDDIDAGFGGNALTIQGMDIAAGTSLDDGRYLYYDYASNSFKYRASSHRGDLYYDNGSVAFARLTPGTTGQVLVTQGSGADPLWAAVSADMPTGLTTGYSGLSGNGSYYENDGSYMYLTIGKNSVGTVVMISGVSSLGGAIPLPTGCAAGDCHWIVSLARLDANTTACNGFEIAVDGSRIVSAREKGNNWV